MKRLLIACCALLVAGCATHGTKVEQDQLSKIEEGVTTKAQIVEMVGAPDHIALVGEGKEVLIYEHIRSKNTVQNFIPVVSLVQSKYEQEITQTNFLIGKDGVLEKISTNTTEKDVKAGLFE